MTIQEIQTSQEEEAIIREYRILPSGYESQNGFVTVYGNEAQNAFIFDGTHRTVFIQSEMTVETMHLLANLFEKGL